MADPVRLLSALAALQFVFAAAVVLLLFPLEDTVSILPLFVVLALALYAYLA